MPEPELLVIGLSAFFGSIIAAVAGLGGGILLLSVLLQFLDPMDAIPVHALIQVASNSSRAVMRRKHISLGHRLAIRLAFNTRWCFGPTCGRSISTFWRQSGHLLLFALASGLEAKFSRRP